MTSLNFDRLAAANFSQYNSKNQTSNFLLRRCNVDIDFSSHELRLAMIRSPSSVKVTCMASISGNFDFVASNFA
jgi:hypothetical protein